MNDMHLILLILNYFNNSLKSLENDVNMNQSKSFISTTNGCILLMLVPFFPDSTCNQHVIAVSPSGKRTTA